MSNHKNVIKSGRAWNGFERDKGKIVHLTEPLPENVCGYWGNKALCGAEPGKRSNGWIEVTGPANCPKCLKKKGGKNG